MKNRFEELWLSADDGASAPIGPLEIRSVSEFDELLDAWFLERSNSIECELVLKQSRKLILRFLNEAEVSASRSRQARRLIQTIDETLRMVSSSDE